MKPYFHPTLAFTLLCLAARTLPAQDVHVYEIWREEYFAQATTNRPALDTARTHAFGAEALPAYDGAILAASLKTPQGPAHSLTDIGSGFVLENNSGGEMTLPAPAPAGAYLFQVTGANQGAIKQTFTLPGEAQAIAPMRIANYNDAQAIDASQTFTLRWDKTINSGPHDYLRIQIFDANNVLVFSQSNFSLTNTSIDLPAGTLQPNTRYHAYLAVLHVFSLNNTRIPYSETFERKLTEFALATLNPAGEISFSASIVSVSETEGAAYFTVRRTQGSAGTVTVDYFSTDGTAHSNVDYTAVSGTLTFPPGVTSQSFPVPLLYNGATTAPLAALLTLTNATGGAVLSVRPHSCLSIRDTANTAASGAGGCLLAREEFYSQTGTNNPAQTNLSVTSRFIAEVQQRYPGSVSYGFLEFPNGQLLALGRSFVGDHGYYSYSQDFPSPASMNATFKPGKYELLFESSSGTALAPVLAMGAEKPITTPHLANWAAAQAIDPASAFGLKWTPFAGGTTNDCVRIVLEDNHSEYLVDSPHPFEANTIPGTANTFTIPAGLLAYGATYHLDIIFTKMTAAGPQPSRDLPSGIASMRCTSMNIKTIPPP